MASKIPVIGLDATWLQSQLLDGYGFFQQMDRYTMVLSVLALVLVPVLASSHFVGSKGTKIPVVNPPGPFELETTKRFDFVQRSMDIIREARKRFPGRPYVVVSNVGPLTVLPAERAQEIRNLPTLNFRKLVNESIVPGNPASISPLMMGDHPAEILPKVIKKHLTKRLNTVTEPLAEETIFVIAKVLEDKSTWTEVTIYNAVLDIVASLSSRVFLGPEVCRNEEWLNITKNYTLVINKATRYLRLFPRFIRPLVYLFDPSCRAAKAQYQRAVKIVAPEVARRRRERQECISKGVAPPVYNDAIEWAELEAAGAPYNETDFQLVLSFAAIHTTSDLISQTMLYVAADPENVKALRAEILEVLRVGGWKKTSLIGLKLLDSAIKEAQRLKPILTLTMLRKVMEDTKLEGGIVLPKGSMTAVDSTDLRNPALHKDPEKYNMYRFREMRDQPGGEHKAQLVSATANHIAFGYGKYACPGRFFAANEIKIALCHLLLKYDWKLAPGTTTEPIYYGNNPAVNPQAKLLYKRRREELDLDSLEIDAAEDEE